MPIVDRSGRDSRRKYATEVDSYYLKLNNMAGRLNFEVDTRFGPEKIAFGCLIAGLVVLIEVQFSHFSLCRRGHLHLCLTVKRHIRQQSERKLK
jgi:hypothetical protein